MKKEKKIQVELILGEGWEEKMAKAAGNLYLRIEAKKQKQTIKN